MPQTAWPKLTCSEPNLLTLEVSSLKLGGQREVLFQNSGQLRAADDIRFLTGTPAPTEKLRILANGNVGIGVANPEARLEVAGFIRATDGLESNAAKKMQVGTRLEQPLELFIASSAALTIAANRNVGIGTAALGHRLTITGGPGWTTSFWSGAMELENGAAIGWRANTNGQRFGLGHTGGGFHFFRTTSDPGTTGATAIFDLVINDVGSVGIGTTTPTQKLHVAGEVITVDGKSGDEQTYMGGDGRPTPTGRDVVFGSLNPAINIVSFWNPSSGTSGNFMDIYTHNIYCRGNLVGGGKGGYMMDQFINNLDEALETGDVVIVGSNQSYLYYGPHENIPVPEVDLTTEAYHTGVCGVICEVYGEPREQSEDRATKTKESKKSKTVVMRPQAFSAEELERLERTQVQPGQIGWMVTLGAFAHCKVDADIAPIKIGDLLTSSPTRGHAQKVLDPGKAVGAIIGKALGSLEKGKGKVPALVMLQ